MHLIFLVCWRKVFQHFLQPASGNWEDSFLLEEKCQQEPSPLKSRCSSLSEQASEHLLFPDWLMLRVCNFRSRGTDAFEFIFGEDNSTALCALARRWIFGHCRQHRRLWKQRYLKNLLDYSERSYFSVLFWRQSQSNAGSKMKCLVSFP